MKRPKKKGSGTRFKYQKRTPEQVKKRAEQRAGNFDPVTIGGVDMWRPKQGENVIRILPPTWDDYEHYGYDVFMHRFIGSDNSNYLCLNKMKGKKCPACDEAKRAKDGGEDDEAKALGYAKRCWVWIIDRDDKSMTPQVWDMSWTQDRDITGLSTFKGKTLYIDHPDDGYDVIVKKSGSGLKTKYAFNIERDASPISDDDEKQEEILQYITEHPIPEILHFMSAAHIEKKLEGTTEERDDELDDDEDDDRRTRKASKRRRDEDDDDDEDEDEKPKKKKKRPAADDDDDDEEDTPRRRRKPADDDDDDDGDDDDEEEEEERPKKKKKRPADDDDDDEEEEEERPKKKKKRPADDDDDDDDEEEEEERPVKKKKKAPVKKKRRARDDDDDEDDDD